MTFSCWRPWAAKLTLTGVALVATVLSGCSHHETSVQPQPAIVLGQLYGVIHMPRAGLPPEARPERLWKFGLNQLPIGSLTISISSDSSEYEFKRTYPTDSLSITIAGRRADIHPDGAFEVIGVPRGKQTVIFYVAGKAVRTETIVIGSDPQKLELTIEHAADCCEHQQHSSVNGTMSQFPCLKKNGIGWGPVNMWSDCWMSLVAGPPWYSWMCWTEAMDRIDREESRNIWCDGSHNCSLFVHGWDWNKQVNHRHYGPWVAKW